MMCFLVCVHASDSERMWTKTGAKDAAKFRGQMPLPSAPAAREKSFFCIICGFEEASRFERANQKFLDQFSPSHSWTGEQQQQQQPLTLKWFKVFANSLTDFFLPLPLLPDSIALSSMRCRQQLTAARVFRNSYGLLLRDLPMNFPIGFLLLLLLWLSKESGRTSFVFCLRKNRPSFSLPSLLSIQFEFEPEKEK